MDKSKYGLAPYVLDYEIVQSSPDEEDFVIGQSTVLATFRYQFLVFSWQKLVDLLAEAKVELDLLQLSNLSYELVNYSVTADSVFLNFKLTLPN